MRAGGGGELLAGKQLPMHVELLSVELEPCNVSIVSTVSIVL